MNDESQNRNKLKRKWQYDLPFPRPDKRKGDKIKRLVEDGIEEYEKDLSK